MNEFRYNNKGFSLVELLAAIVILGLLSTFAVVSIGAILDRAEKNHYQTQQKDIVMAAQSYAQDNRNILPKEIGESREITLQELQSRKYIGDILDRSKNKCTVGSVTIFKYAKDGYSYRPYLKCQKYETSKEDYGENGPEITLSLDKNYAKPSFSYEITSSGDSKIISYSYVIYKHGVLVRDSGSIPVSRVNKVDKKVVSLKDLVPGEFEIILRSTNVYGYSSTRTVSGNIIDEGAPECYNITPVYTEADWRRYTEPVVINVNCRDTDGSGCAKEIFSQKFYYDTGKNFIEMIDNSGVKSNCEVGVYIDNTPPSKPVISNPYENVWINKSYTIQVSSVDETSGIKYFEYRYPNSVEASEREWTKYENSNKDPKDTTPFTTTPFSKERSEYVEIRACDYAGNCSESTQSMIKLDKTVPTCTISRSITSPNGANGWYVSDVTMNMSLTDNTSGVATAVKSPIAYELTTNKTPVYSAMNLSAVQNETKGLTWNGYIKDEAGNVSSCTDESGDIKIDTTPPTCKLSVNTSQVTFANRTENTSGFAGYSIDRSSTPSYDSSTSASFDTGTFYGHLKDNAGNTNTCKATVTNTTKTTGTERYCTANEDSGGCYKYTGASAHTTYEGVCSCKKRIPGSGGWYHIQSTCTSSGGCSCPGDMSTADTSGCRRKTTYSCSSGYLVGSSCKVYIGYSTRPITVYVCDSGYTKMNDSYCYKLV